MVLMKALKVVIQLAKVTVAGQIKKLAVGSEMLDPFLKTFV